MKYLKPFNFIDMLNHFVKNITVWPFNRVYKHNLFTNHIFNVNVKYFLYISSVSFFLSYVYIYIYWPSG